MDLPSASVVVASLSENGVCNWGASLRGLITASVDSRDARVVAADGAVIVARGAAWRATGSVAFVRDGKSGAAFAVRAAAPESEAALARVLDACCCCCSSSSHAGNKKRKNSANGGGGGGGEGRGGGESAVTKDAFERKTDAGSAELYFHYYGMLQHQQNMLQDYVRTGTYWAAIHENAADFRGKVVVDVGAGSGILSLFAAQAGAERVYAVEASAMAEHAERLCAANAGTAGGRGGGGGGGGERVTVVRARVESAPLPRHCADVLVSEPMGTLLLNERMLESYVFARDTLLKPGGRMFPALGRIHVAAFSDPQLHAEMAAKASFWRQRDFYGVDVSCLEEPAASAYFRQVVVDAVDPASLVSGAETLVVDFGSATVEELARVVVPLRLVMATAGACEVHGVAAWFDVLFDGSGSGGSGSGGSGSGGSGSGGSGSGGSGSGGSGSGGSGSGDAASKPSSSRQRWLSTAPGLPTTHWFQLRCVLREPLVVSGPGAVLEGELVLEAHERQSYDVHLSLSLPRSSSGSTEAKATFDLKDPYYRQAAPWSDGSGWGGGVGCGGGAAAAAAAAPGQ